MTITRVENIGDEGIEDNLRGPADLYAFVEIGGTPFHSKDIHIDDEDVVEPVNPPWTFTRSFPSGDPDAVGVSIEIWEHDDCDAPRCTVGPPDIFGGSDDHGDADPDAGDDDVDLVVDRNTGTWSGDAPSTETCSQGDDTGDGDRRVRVCWDISVTSPSGDADADGLLDGWEIRGLDSDGDGTIDVDLPAFGADPLHKDLFLELDWETGQTPGRADIQAMKAALRAAPLSNPDGTNGVNLWVDMGPLVDPGAREGQAAGTCGDGADNGGDGLVDGADTNCRFLDGSVEDPQPTTCANGTDNDADGLVDADDPDCLVGDDLGGGSMVNVTGSCNLDDAFYDAKAVNFDSARRWVFRYAVSLGLEGSCPGSGGWGEVGGNDFMDFNHDGGTLLHELGHNLNLRHGGNENNNCKPNYVSVMNYDNQFGIRRAGGGRILDYSPSRDSLDGVDRGVAPLATLVENDLDDGVVLDGSDGRNRYVFTNPNGAKVTAPLNQGANWNSDADPPAEANQAVNIDTNATGGGPAACANGSSNDTLESFNDWSQASLPFRQFGDSADGAIDPETTPSPTRDELEDLEEALNTTDLALSIADAPDPVAAGTPLTYTLTVRNDGPNPATSVRVVDTLPAGVTFASASPGCTAAAGVVTCNLGEILAFASRDVTITVDVPPDLVYDNGAPVTLTNEATVANLAGPDADGTDNAAETTTQVIAVADVRVDSVTTTSPLEVVIGEPSPVGVEVAVANDGPSSPVDAVLTGTVTADAGVSVTPTDTSADVTALAVGTPQTVEQDFTLECTAPGVQSVTVTYEIALANDADVDPDLADNTRDASFEVDCVVPVAVNVRPGGFPNPINLNTDATLAVLTTAAGEYGLPLAFDAATIDVATVRWGLRSNLLNTATPSGAKEVHGKNHLERSWELDETTRDADRDGVMHFKPAASGLTLDTTEGCVKGRFASGGQTYTFFGCDSVVVPN